MADNNTNTDDIILDEDAILGTAGPSGAGANINPGAKKPASASIFHIPQVVKDKYPKLVKLILGTESMDNEEREYWFQILPIMTADQVKKFTEILVSEKEQLAKLDAEYEKELEKINKKYDSTWQDYESTTERKQRIKEEKVSEEKEVAAEEEILNKLEEI